MDLRTATCFCFSTNRGTFHIRRRSDGRWEPCLDDEPFDGSYHTPQQAVDDLAGGHTSWPSETGDPSKLGLPSDLGDWATCRRHR
jgi:hypothetical protein